LTIKVLQSHETVRCLLIRAIQICEGDESTLWLGQGRLANAYRARWGDNDSNTLEAPSDLMSLRTNSSPSVSVGLSRSRLEILAEEAARIQPFSDNDGDPYMGGARSIPEQAEQQLRAREEGPVAGQVPRLASNETDTISMATYGQHVQSPWDTYATHDHAAVNEVPAEVAHSYPLDNHIERQPGDADLRPLVCVTAARDDRPMNVLDQISASDQRFATDAGVYSVGAATGMVQVPAPTQATSAPTVSEEQAVQSQWRTYIEQNPSQQTLLQHAPLYGAESSAHYGFDHAGMDRGQQSQSSGCWPATNHPESHETAAPHFLPDSDMDGMYQSTTGNGHDMNDEWRRTVAELYTQHGLAQLIAVDGIL
jgi:hypothetical protein